MKGDGPWRPDGHEDQDVSACLSVGCFWLGVVIVGLPMAIGFFNLLWAR